MNARLIRRACRRRTAHWGRLALPFAVMAGSVLAADLVFWSGWRLNLTESEPLGWYRLRPLDVGQAIHRGAKVELCPPLWVTPRAFPFYLSGDCPGGGMPMLKTVVAIPGDHVVVNLRGVRINGRELPNSGQLLRSGNYPSCSCPTSWGA